MSQLRISESNQVYATQVVPSFCQPQPDQNKHVQKARPGKGILGNIFSSNPDRELLYFWGGSLLLNTKMYTEI